MGIHIITMTTLENTTITMSIHIITMNTRGRSEQVKETAHNNDTNIILENMTKAKLINVYLIYIHDIQQIIQYRRTLTPGKFRPYSS